MRVNHIHDHYRGVNVPHSKSYIIDMSWLNKRRHYFCFFCHILLTFDLCLFFADCHPRFKEIICRELYLACSSSKWLLWRPVPVRHIFGTTLYCQVREKKILAILYFFIFLFLFSFEFFSPFSVLSSECFFQIFSTPCCYHLLPTQTPSGYFHPAPLPAISTLPALSAISIHTSSHFFFPVLLTALFSPYFYWISPLPFFWLFHPHVFLQSLQFA